MSARAWLAFGAVSVLWGMPYLFIKIAVDDGVPPAFLAWARVALGSLILVPLAWRLGLLSALRGRGRWILAYAVLERTTRLDAPWRGDPRLLGDRREARDAARRRPGASSGRSRP